MVRKKRAKECAICGKASDTLRDCIICNRRVCPTHYLIMLGLCTECARDRDKNTDA